MKRTAFAAAIVSGLIVSLVFGVRFIQLAEANGIVMQVPVTYNGSPIITVDSPLKNATVSSNSVVVSFTLTRPDNGWTSEFETSNKVNKVVSINVIVDGAVYRSVDVDSELLVPFSYSLNLTDLENGEHRLQLYTYCRGVKTTYLFPSNDILDEQPLNYEVLSYIVRFTVDVPEPFPSTLFLASSVGIALGAAGILVYFKKRKH